MKRTRPNPFVEGASARIVQPDPKGLSATRCTRRAALSFGLLAVTAGAVSGCGGADPEELGPLLFRSSTGVQVRGTAAAPRIAVPSRKAPARLTVETLAAGNGPRVEAKGSLVYRSLGQAWDTGDEKDTRFLTMWGGAPGLFLPDIDTGFPQWRTALVGRRVGDRVLVTVPEELGYRKVKGGSGIDGVVDAAQGMDIAGYESYADRVRPHVGRGLVFLVEIVAFFAPTAAADGVPAAGPAAGPWPRVDSQPGQQPRIVSVAGVEASTTPRAKLLLQGAGEPLKTGKTAAVQALITPLQGIGQPASSWGVGPDLTRVDELLPRAPGLEPLRLGSRVLSVGPGISGSVEVAVIDVLAQF